jgi:hypothetical protein
VVVKREGCSREGTDADWCCYTFCMDNPDVGVELEGTIGGGDCADNPNAEESGAKLLIILWINSSEGAPSTINSYEVRVHTIYSVSDPCCDPPYVACDNEGFLEGSFLEAAPDSDCSAVENLDLPYVERTCHQYDLSGATCTISAV